MKSDLEELIEAYEMEKAELEKQISEYVDEGDYFYAHHHNRALRQKKQTPPISRNYLLKIRTQSRMITCQNICTKLKAKFLN